jgi:hypothetical protein
MRKLVTQDDLIASIDRVDKGLAECFSLVESVLDQPAYDDKFPSLQHFQAVSAKRSAHSRRQKWQDADLTITVTPEGRIVQRRPLSRSDLPKANWEAPAKNVVMAHPFELANTTTIYQEAIRDRYTDQIGHNHALIELDLPKANQYAPAINIVHIHQLGEDSLLPILEEDLGAELEGSTKTVTKNHHRHFNPP